MSTPGLSLSIYVMGLVLFRVSVSLKSDAIYMNVLDEPRPMLYRSWSFLLLNNQICSAEAQGGIFFHIARSLEVGIPRNYFLYSRFLSM